MKDYIRCEIPNHRREIEGGDICLDIRARPRILEFAAAADAKYFVTFGCREPTDTSTQETSNPGDQKAHSFSSRAVRIISLPSGCKPIVELTFKGVAIPVTHRHPTQLEILGTPPNETGNA
jgi:hypothetical protein